MRCIYIDTFDIIYLLIYYLYLLFNVLKMITLSKIRNESVEEYCPQNNTCFNLSADHMLTRTLAKSVFIEGCIHLYESWLRLLVREEVGSTTVIRAHVMPWGTYRISYGFCVFPWTEAGGQRSVRVYEVFAN